MSFTPLEKTHSHGGSATYRVSDCSKTKRHNPNKALRMHVGNFGGYGVRQSGRVPVHTITHSGYVQRLLRPWTMPGHLPLPPGNLPHTWQSATLTQGQIMAINTRRQTVYQKYIRNRKFNVYAPKPTESTSRQFANTRTDLEFLCRTARRAILPALMIPRKSPVIVFRYDSVQHPFVLWAGV